MGKKWTRASGFWWYVIAVVFTNVRQLGVVVKVFPIVILAYSCFLIILYNNTEAPGLAVSQSVSYLHHRAIIVSFRVPGMQQSDLEPLIS